MIMKRLLSMVLISVGLTGFKLDCDHVVRGTIISSEDGKPRRSVTVKVPHTQITALTDSFGRYTIHIPCLYNNILDFHFIGFRDQTIYIGNKNVVNIKMAA